LNPRTIIDQLIRPLLSEKGELYYYNLHFERYVDTLSLMSREKKFKALDIGAGVGHLSILLKELFGYDVFTADIDETYISRFASFGIPFKKCDVESESLPFHDQDFDYVLFCEIIEHINDPWNVLREIHRVLQPNGVLILTTPSSEVSLKPFRELGYLFLLHTIYPKNYVRPTGGFVAHGKYTLIELVEILEKTGFHIDRKHLSGCWEKNINFNPPKNLSPFKLLLFKIRHAFRKIIRIPVQPDIMIKARKPRIDG